MCAHSVMDGESSPSSRTTVQGVVLHTLVNGYVRGALVLQCFVLYLIVWVGTQHDRHESQVQDCCVLSSSTCTWKLEYMVLRYSSNKVICSSRYYNTLEMVLSAHRHSTTTVLCKNSLFTQKVFPTRLK